MSETNDDDVQRAKNQYAKLLRQRMARDAAALRGMGVVEEEAEATDKPKTKWRRKTVLTPEEIARLEPLVLAVATDEHQTFYDLYLAINEEGVTSGQVAAMCQLLTDRGFLDKQPHGGRPKYRRKPGN